MNKQEIEQRLRALGLPEEEYWVAAGSAMVLYGIKEETGDIDLGCSSKLADRLEAEGYPAENLADGSRKFLMGRDIEVFEGWLFDRVESADGFPVISLKGLVMMKEALGREKDLADLATIKAFMHGQRKN